MLSSGERTLHTMTVQSMRRTSAAPISTTGEKHHARFLGATRSVDAHSSGVWGLVLGCLMLPGIAAAQSSPSLAGTALTPGTMLLTVTDSVLSLEANAASLATICTAIDQQTGIEIVLHHEADHLDGSWYLLLHRLHE